MLDLLKSIVDPLKDSATVRTIYGEPIPAHGKTIIPVARIAYGFGGGGGKGVRGSKTGEAEGGGGGGGIMAIPIGVVEITAERTRFIPLHDKRKLVAAGFAGLCLGLFWARRVSAGKK